MVKTPWDKTDQELNQELSKNTSSEVHKQTVFLMEILRQVGEAIQANKTVKVENIVRQVVGKVAIERPDWIKELKIDPTQIEKKLDYIASAIIRKEVVRKVDVNRPEWLSELIPKEKENPEPQDFSAPIVDLLKEIIHILLIEKEKDIESVIIAEPIEVKKPSWYIPLDISQPLVSFGSFLKKLLDQTIFKSKIEGKVDVEIKNEKLDVTVLNPQTEIAMKNVKEITKRLDLLSAQLVAAGNTGSNAAAGGSSGGGTDVSTLNKETTQQALLTNEQSVLTEVQQLHIIEESINELVNRLDFLPSVRGIAADLRVTLLSGAVTTVGTITTLSTLTNQTQNGGYNTNQIVPAAQNGLAIQSNINNIIIT